MAVLNIRQNKFTWASQWPDENSTGSSGSLTAVPGTATSGTGWSWDGDNNVVVTTSSSVTIENLDITSGGIVVLHSNVTLRNCEITLHSTSISGVFIEQDVSNTTVEDCTIIGPGGTGGIGKTGTNCGYGTNAGATIQRCNISGVENGISVSGENHEILDNYIHDLIPYDIGGDPHIDGIQCFTDDTDNCLIQGNNIISHDEANSALTSGDGNMVINNNRFIGGGYTIYLRLDGTNTFTNNRIDGGAINYYTDSGGGTGTITWSGNVDDSSGATIPAP